MTSSEFCYWLMGCFELSEPSYLDSTQTELIKRHLDMVFVHEIKRPTPVQPSPHSPFAHFEEGARC